MRNEDVFMPRGIKGSGKNYKTIEEQIEELDAKITDYKEKVNEAKKQRQQLEETKEKADYGQLLRAIRDSGLSVGDVVELVNEKK
jgi:chromosome segregation ATPase